ncbi:hypothetical protein E8E12_008969 [Didymella heteroderae]|uniref:Uncharacterized protein n=1 Tax=Didymella heteroderae TaxID=1769908 RepID=A0A9P4X1N0_9PLEO|nr:hypothetical protein E8E12_008969 [Didymella heteroderae]
MTASAGYYPQDSFPTSFSFGALFGNRSDPQTSWRYEPPSLPRSTPALSSYSPTWDDAPSATAQPQGSVIDPTSTDRKLSQTVTQRCADSVDQYGSSDAVDGMSSNLSASEHTLLNRNELEQSLEDFKTGFAAAQSGRSTKRVEGYFKELFQQNSPSTPYLWQYCATVLRHLDSVGGSPVPVLRVLLEGDGRFLRVLNARHSLSGCAAFLDSLDMVWENDHGRRRKPFVHRLFRVMAQLATEAEKSTTEAQDHLLLRLLERMAHRVPHTELKTLRGLASNLSESAENKLLLSLFDEAKQVQETIVSTICNSTVRGNAAPPVGFADAVRLLSHMPRHHLLGVVPAVTLCLAKRAPGPSRDARLAISRHSMETWLCLIHQIDCKGEADNKLLDTAICSLAETLGVHVNSKWAPLPNSPKYFVKAVLLRQGLDLQVQYSAETLPRIQNVLAVVLVQLQTQPKAYTAFLDSALPLVAQHAGLVTLLRCLRTMEEEGLPLSTHTDFASVITHELAELELPAASLSHVQARERAYTLQACKRLVKVLSRAGYTLPAMTQEVRQFNNVLENARINHALPIDRRDTAIDLPLMERIVLVHQLAHHYSTDTTLTQREAWRQIYYLYKYLDTNSLPLGPLFTKSVTHVAITRPLLENRFVSARRLIWVCHLVARVQGDAIAAQVEADFYKQRGEIIRRAKKTFIGFGGSKHNKAHIGPMKRLGMI